MSIAECKRSAIDYVTPNQCLAGHRDAIVERRKHKHREAAQRRIEYWSEKDLDAPEPHAVMEQLGEAEEARA